MSASKGISTLSAQVAGSVIEYIQSRDLRQGDHLPEQALADALSVSRFPVRKALQLLNRQGLLKYQRDKGFYLKADADSLSLSALRLPVPDIEASYQEIVDDYLRGELEQNITATRMQDRYRLSRDRFLKIINRMVHEGWAYKRQGQGWAFVKMAASAEAHRQNYLFRMAVEPAALLDPGCRVDKVALQRLRSQQMMLLDGGIETMSKLQLLNAGAAFHEAIVAFSRNNLFIDAVKRANQLRRLAEYRARMDRSKIPDYCRQHLAILDLLEVDDRAGAADLLRAHLDAVKQARAGTGD